MITGRVHGVFYREWTVSRAREIGVSGWVRNRSNGRVEVYAKGDNAQLARFVDKLREGSPSSKVESVELEEVPVERCKSFLRRQSV